VVAPLTELAGAGVAAIRSVVVPGAHPEDQCNTQREARRKAGHDRPVPVRPGAPGHRFDGHHLPEVAWRFDLGQRAQPLAGALQLAQLAPASGTGRDVRRHLRMDRLPVAQAQQLLGCDMHGFTSCSRSGPSSSLSRRWARASWDFEKLTVLPISTAISWWL
jgi:hypothetical protein